MIESIDVGRLRPHPLNPRKDLGDLSELAASIRAQGVLQNLTVVPADTQEFERLKAECDFDPHHAGAFYEYDGDYIVVIGHRRLAAAKLAGLEEIPCAVSDMPEKEQVATMLSENLQRRDLTLLEESEGIQQLLDFGEGFAGIAAMTGLSETTVRRRARLLAELGGERVAAAMGKQPTLEDFELLYGIASDEERDKALEDIGTPSFKWAVDKAKEREAAAVFRERIEGALDADLVDKVEKAPMGSRYVRSFAVDKDGAKDAESWHAPDGDEDYPKRYVYESNPYRITLYRLPSEGSKAKADDAEAAYAAKRDELEKRLAGLKSAFRTAYQLRLSFAKGFRPSKQAAGEVQRMAAWPLLFKDRAPKEDAFRDFFGIKEELRPKWKDGEGESYEEAAARLMGAPKYAGDPALLLFAAAYVAMENPARTCYNFYGVYGRDEQLEALYARLAALGYRASTDEEKLLDGTHELYAKPDYDEDYDGDDYDADDFGMDN
jgi:ParB family chromosome partitioning protein